MNDNFNKNTFENFQWTANKQKNILIINNSSENFKKEIDLGSSIIFYEELEKNIVDSKLKSAISEWYLEYSTKKIEMETNGVEDADEDEEEEKIEPYDPNEVKYTLKLFTVSSLVDYITGFNGEEDPTVLMEPDFQRKFVWSSKDKSLLIESILLNIPIPAIYLNETDSGEYLPADGLQRLNTLEEFLTGKLKLKNLEYLTEYEDYKYKKTNENDKSEKILPINVRRQIRDYQVTSYIIEKSTPEKVKLDIFKRLNSGGVKLTAQELRNSITSKKVRNLYNSIEDNKFFKLLVKDTVNTNRFVHHEFILRYFAFYYWEVLDELKYQGSTKSLLDDVLIEMNKENNNKLNTITEDFLAALEKSYQLFGGLSFRKFADGKQKKPINTALYTRILIKLTNYNEIDFERSSGYATEKFKLFLENNNEFMTSISTATNNTKNINIAKKYIDIFFEGLN